MSTGFLPFFHKKQCKNEFLNRVYVLLLYAHHAPQNTTQETMDTLYLCIHALSTKGLIFKFPLSLMNAERDAQLEMFPDSDADSDMLRRLQVRVSETILRIMEEHVDYINPRNYYVSTTRGIETENGDTPNYIHICDANMDDNAFQIYFLHALGSFDKTYSGLITTVPDDIMDKDTEIEKEESLELYMRRLIQDHFEPVDAYGNASPRFL